MKNTRSKFDSDERMFKVTYWLIIGLIVVICACALSGSVWGMWVITTVVTK